MDKKKLRENLQGDRDSKFRIWKEYHDKVLANDNPEYNRYWVNFYDERVRALDYAMEVLRQHDII